MVLTVAQCSNNQRPTNSETGAALEVVRRNELNGVSNLHGVNVPDTPLSFTNTVTRKYSYPRRAARSPAPNWLRLNPIDFREFAFTATRLRARIGWDHGTVLPDEFLRATLIVAVPRQGTAESHAKHVLRCANLQYTQPTVQSERRLSGHFCRRVRDCNDWVFREQNCSGTVFRGATDRLGQAISHFIDAVTGLNFGIRDDEGKTG